MQLVQANKIVTRGTFFAVKRLLCVAGLPFVGRQPLTSLRRVSREIQIVAQPLLFRIKILPIEFDGIREPRGLVQLGFGHC